MWTQRYSLETLTHDPTGNDPELDPNRPADPPTRAIEKPVMRHGKRDGPDAPKPMPERLSHQNRAKQTDNCHPVLPDRSPIIPVRYLLSSVPLRLPSMRYPRTLRSLSRKPSRTPSYITMALATSP